MDAEKVGVRLTDGNFQTTVLRSEKPVLVAFWSAGCSPMAPQARIGRGMTDGAVT